jgi:hypothetical protein
VKPQGYIPPSASPSAHEGADLHIRNVVTVAAVLGVTLIISILIVALFFRYMEKAHPGRTSEAAPVVLDSQLPPLPRLQTHPLLDLQTVRDVENSHLDRYAWIDREHDIAQIPIERAMILWTRSYSAAPPPMAPTAPATNAAPAVGITELQMRQQKAQEASHAP